MSLDLPALLFWIICSIADIVIVIVLLGAKRETLEEIAAGIYLGFCLGAVIPLWIGATKSVSEGIKNSNSIPEGFTIYATVLSGLSVIASIISLYITRRERVLTTVIIGLSFVIYTSSVLAKFYFVDIYIPFLLNQCDKEKHKSTAVCSLLDIDSLNKYQIYFNVSTFSLSLLLVIAISYIMFILYRKGLSRKRL